MERVVLLNSDYSFLNTIDWKRAMRLIVKGKVEVVKSATEVINNIDRSFEMFLPKVLRLVKLVRSVYRNKVPYSKRNIFIRDAFMCQYCGKEDIGKPTLDHILPKSRGGKSTFENCVCACKRCNNTKNDRTPHEAGMGLRCRPYQPTIMEYLIVRMKKLGVDDLLRELGVF